MRRTTMLLIIILVAIVSCNRQEPISEKLWYTSPAEDWFSALPLGNGRLGAMVYGTIEEEHIQMNEESLWAGCPEDPYPPNVKEHYQKFRELNLRGEYAVAFKYAMDHLAISPTSFRSYTPLGDLFINLNHNNAANYRRELDLETGINTVEYEIDGKGFRREAFISDKYNAMFFHFTSLDGEKMDAAIRYERESDIDQHVDDHHVLCIDGQLFDDPEGYDDNQGGSGKGGYHMKFASLVAVKPDGGELEVNNQQIGVAGVREFTVIVSSATDYNPGLMNFDRSIDAEKKAYSILEKALDEPYAKIKKDHIKAHSEVYNRVDFSISDIEQDEIPTNERIERLKENIDAQDNYLTQVLFQYGRYLLMGSSGGQATLPANLQGIWSKDMWAAWEADYHLDINLQMNYWPADICNLSDAFDPLSDYIYRLAEKGNTTANNYIGSDGWMAHTCANVFGRTTAVGSNKISQVKNGYCFPLAGTWMSLSLWRHYQFIQDRQYLEETVCPVIQGATRFILDFLVENDRGELVTVPSNSPENEYIDPETGQSTRNTVASTIDIQIIRELFQACLETEKILGEQQLSDSVNKALSKLPEMKIGTDGTIQEWYEDYQEVNPAHRHISHLFGLHPAGLITPATPDLFDAALKTLERRLSYGGGQTGWSRAWVINFYARLLQGNDCNRHINALITQLAAPNLFDLHPPHLFQIDGNFGATAGIAEMLIQSHEENLVRLLPALPDAWGRGYIRGLKARGSYVVEMNWEGGILQYARITAEKGGHPTLVYGEKEVQLDLEAGEIYKIDFSMLQ